MEALTPVQGTILVAAIGLIGTIIVALIAKYKPVKKKDQTEIVFERMDTFIEQQKQDRDDLREEIKGLRERVESAEARVDEVELENASLKRENEKLRQEVGRLRRQAEAVAATKVIEDKAK